MSITIKHAKTANFPDWTQADVDKQIALGNLPAGTTPADMVLKTDWNNNHSLSGAAANGILYADGSGNIQNSANATLDSSGNMLLNGTLFAGDNAVASDVPANLAPDFQTSPFKYDSGAGTTVNKWALYNNPGGAVYGVGMSANYGFGLFAGDRQFTFFTGTTNVDGTGATVRMQLDNQFLYLYDDIGVARAQFEVTEGGILQTYINNGYLFQGTIGVYQSDILKLDPVGAQYSIGDILSSNNGTHLVVDDFNGDIYAYSSSFTVSGVGVFQQYVITYQNQPTAGNGMPAIYGEVDSTGNTAAKGSTLLYAVPSGFNGHYRVSFYAKVTTPASTSSVLGGTNGFRVSFTDADDSVAVTTAGLVNDSGVTLNLNTTQTMYSGSVIINPKSNTNINFTFDYTSAGVTPMAYNLHIRAERL